jgi:hypothetical protein
MNCGIIVKRGDTTMKTSKGVSVKPIWFLENHPWNANQTKVNKRVPFVLIYHHVFDVAAAIHEHWSVIVMQNIPRNTGCGLQKTRLVTAEISTSKPGIGQCKGVETLHDLQKHSNKCISKDVCPDAGIIDTG